MDSRGASRLRDVCYVDYAGASLHSDAQSQAISSLLQSELLCNPHSSSSASDAHIRKAVLSLFHADHNQYALIWTSGATAALKLIGENFDWREGRAFVYHGNVHNSALGIREYAKAGGAQWKQLLVDEDVHRCGQGNGGLFALSAQCNFSGEKPDYVRMTREMREKNWFVCLDAAALCSTSPLDLSACQADFVCVSFYKIFGLPSGLGALIARRDSIARCFRPARTYFGGGTVEACAASEDFVVLRKDVSARYEDGTTPFLAIATLRASLDSLASVGGMTAVQAHSFGIAHHFARELAQMRHHHGRAAFVIYGGWNDDARVSPNTQGATVTFNGVRADGSWVGYSEVGKLASLNKIILRTGCFCNAGACQRWLNLSARQIRDNLSKGHVCWDDHDVIDGMPTGAVRVSFGWLSTMEDARTVLNMLRASFVESAAPVALSLLNESGGCDAVLKQIWLYPVKSFGGMQVARWEIGRRGLLYDREWALVDSGGTYLNQKSLPAMCRVHATVKPEEGKLVLRADGFDDLVLPLDPRDESSQQQQRQEVLVCGDSCESVPYGRACSNWLESVLGCRCTLVRMTGSGRNNAAARGKASEAKISFANEAQFLVVSEESLSDLQSRLSEDQRSAGEASRFRANFVVGGGETMRAHAEDQYEVMIVGGTQVFRTVGPCARCEMICIDAATLTRSREPLRTLASYRRSRGRIFFGSLFTHEERESKKPFTISVGDAVHFNRPSGPQ